MSEDRSNEIALDLDTLSRVLGTKELKILLLQQEIQHLRQKLQETTGKADEGAQDKSS